MRIKNILFLLIAAFPIFAFAYGPAYVAEITTQDSGQGIQVTKVTFSEAIAIGCSAEKMVSEVFWDNQDSQALSDIWTSMALSAKLQRNPINFSFASTNVCSAEEYQIDGMEVLNGN